MPIFFPHWILIPSLHAFLSHICMIYIMICMIVCIYIYNLSLYIYIYHWLFIDPSILLHISYISTSSSKIRWNFPVLKELWGAKELSSSHCQRPPATPGVPNVQPADVSALHRQNRSKENPWAASDVVRFIERCSRNVGGFVWETGVCVF